MLTRRISFLPTLVWVLPGTRALMNRTRSPWVQTLINYWCPLLLVILLILLHWKLIARKVYQDHGPALSVISQARPTYHSVPNTGTITSLPSVPVISLKTRAGVTAAILLPALV